MARPSEEISRYNTSSNGKTDSNLANDSKHLGGVPADDFATKKYVHDFHGAKEELLKQYIDNQDENKLDQAKSYTDTVVRNQDFSDFLKTADKIALQQQITQCGENCANNLNMAKTQINNRIDGIVTDVNSNFSNINGAINSLNNTTNNLFTSVSNGKSQVASAITDKGVVTTSDASFQTMANNIRRIPTSGGGGGSGGDSGTDTSDATATSNTLFAGYTAYARGQKILGTYVPPYEREQDGITYIDNGIDTSDATATASDIAIGKTAYVNGNKIIGTYRQVIDTTRNGYNTVSVSNQDNSSSEIIEYYGASMENYSIKSSELLSDDNNTNLISFTPDNTYSIQMCRDDGTDTTELGHGIFDYTIVTHKVEYSGQVWTTTNVVFDKCAWTKSELGLADNEVVVDMILGSPGVMGRSDLCWLILQVETYVYNESTSQYVSNRINNGYKHYVYTFNMKKSGIIGKASSSDSHFVWHREILLPNSSYSYTYKILSANLNCNNFIIYRTSSARPYSAYVGYLKLRNNFF